MSSALLNGLLFNISWLAIVYGQSLVVSLLVVIAHLGVHARLMCRGQAEWLLIAAVTLFGLVLDQLLFALGVFNIGGHESLAPLWLACLWPVLATTLSHAFTFLHSRPLLASLAGGIGGAASYLAGTRISSVDFGSELYGPIIIAIIWSLLFPLLLRLAVMTSSTPETDHAPA